MKKMTKDLVEMYVNIQIVMKYRLTVTVFIKEDRYEL